MITTEVDYRILGYHKEFIFDAKGDLITVKYWQDYDGTTFSNLMVEETRTFTRDAINGILLQRDMVIDWYVGTDILATKSTTKYYETQIGYAKNKKARQNLVDKGSMYLLSQIGLTDGKDFLRQVKTEIGGYVAGDIQPLLDAIQDSTEIYMTGTIKATLDAILNITY